jgi:hypothetical protein
MTGGPPGDKKVRVMGVPIQVGENPGVGAQRIVRLQLTTTRQGKQFNLDTEKIRISIDPHLFWKLDPDPH